LLNQINQDFAVADRAARLLMLATQNLCFNPVNLIQGSNTHGADTIAVETARTAPHPLQALIILFQPPFRGLIPRIGENTIGFSQGMGANKLAANFPGIAVRVAGSAENAISGLIELGALCRTLEKFSFWNLSRCRTDIGINRL
jgi:uncharacterized protein (DUF58 family)